jgi:hypothetical protein
MHEGFFFSPKFDIKISQAKDGWKTSLFESKLKVLNPKNLEKGRIELWVKFR